MVDFFSNLIDDLFSLFFPVGVNLDITKFLVFCGALIFIFTLTGRLIKGKY